MSYVSLKWVSVRLLIGKPASILEYPIASYTTFYAYCTPMSTQVLLTCCTEYWLSTSSWS